MTATAIDAVADLPPLREVIAVNGLAADKRLGQNFLLDLNLTGRIARQAGDLALGTTIEVGPGPGGLTRALLLAGAERLVAIEKDPRCVAALQQVVEAAAGRLVLIEGDALAQDAEALGPAPRRIVANLPYNIGTALLVRWLARIDEYESLTLMFQKEVAQRIVATPGSEHYGRLSVLARHQAEGRILFDIPPRAFTPPPKIVSAVVQLVPRGVREPCSLPILEQVTAAAFGQRRKMLRSSLKSLRAAPGPLLEAAGIDPTARAEEIDGKGFAALARAYEAALAIPSPGSGEG